MRYFDSHAHYWDEKFTENGEGLLEELFASSVCGIVNVGTSPETCRLAVALAARFPKMYTALGVHPTDCRELPTDPTEAVAEIRRMLLDPASRAVAVGEIGLDYHWEPYDKEQQKAYFRAQMTLAEELDLPVVIHDREAHGDCFDLVAEFPRVRGVFHSYSGSAEMARALVARGWYVSFSGTLTFKNASKVREAALAVPQDRVLLETDAPYLAPHPHRGALNHSGYLSYTCATLAELWGVSEEEAAAITERNARQLFRIPAAE